ncbi:MAG: hypothetical protein V3V96_14440 [Acidiferrobacterales bacterium]
MWTKSLWDEIPWDQIQAGEREGWVFHDDFINMPNLSVDADLHKYAAFIDTNATITQGVANEFGEVVLLSDAGENIGANLTTGGQTGGLSKFILQATAVPHTIAFEARMKTSTLVGSVYIGFSEEGLGTTEGILSNTGTLSDKNHIGFLVPEADPDGLDFVYNKESGAAPTTMIADIHTMVADEYVKVGFIYNYKNAAAKQIKVYKNGVRNATFVTKALIDNTTNFPGGEEMGLAMAFKNVTDIKNFTVDWWRAALVVNS